MQHVIFIFFLWDLNFENRKKKKGAAVQYTCTIYYSCTNFHQTILYYACTQSSTLAVYCLYFSVLKSIPIFWNCAIPCTMVIYVYGCKASDLCTWNERGIMITSRRLFTSGPVKYRMLLGNIMAVLHTQKCVDRPTID